MLVASESMVSESALNLFHVEAADGIGHPSLRFARFFAPSVFAIRRPRVSRILPRPRRNTSSTRFCNLQPPYPAVLPAMRIRIRRPDARRTAISLCRSALFFFFASTLGRHVCQKRVGEEGGLPVCRLLYATERAEATPIRHILGSPRISSTISEFMRI